ncbi:MAG: type IV secretory system conjugative DNA transfer family protein [Oscillospiraceae bacterium]|nr:type IV secretory system conjugative DNA transfer family protein [Oscillospiraceae bacterium]
MKNDSMKDERILAKGITVSNDTKVTGFNNNDLIIGSSGSGKTGGYVIPNLQNPNGSLVVSDTKGQLARMFSKQLKDKGYRVCTLDLVHPEKSCGYNPLSGIRRYKSGKYCEQDVLTLASNIMPMLDAVEPFWEQAAAGYIAFLIAFCLETLPPEEQNMISVCELHTRFIKPGGNLSFIKWAETHQNSYAAKRFTRHNSAMTSEKMWSCIMEFANRALEPFDFEEARTIFENLKSFYISSLGREKTVLFLNVSDTDRTFDNLVNVFYTQALQILCSNADKRPNGRLKVPVRIIMDDFAASARIPDFDKIISVIRSRDISVSLVLQSMTQLEAMYTHAEATTIINNCDHIIYLGSQDLQTAEFIGNRIFKTPDTVLCTPRDKAIIITTGEKAVMVDKIKPYSTLKI